VTLREGNQTGLADWSQLFDPINRFGLALINTHGSPTEFNLPGGPGQTSDVPASVPTAILMIHSFSAADPTDPQTIAGRWLANGAFVYFGSMNEPFLQAFRSPAQVAELLSESVPLGAAIRRIPPEAYSQPWRLVYLGDPLYRLLSRAQRPARLGQWAPLASWPAYTEFPQPAATAPDGTRLSWALKTALYQLQASARPQQRIDLAAVLLAIRREALEARLRPIHDALLIETLLQGFRRGILLDRLQNIPPAESSALVTRTRETLQMATLHTLVAARNFNGALALWSEALRSRPAPSFLQAVTGRISGLADTPARRNDWRTRLQVAQRKLQSTDPRAAIIAAELTRVEQQIADQR